MGFNEPANECFTRTAFCAQKLVLLKPNDSKSRRFASGAAGSGANGVSTPVPISATHTLFSCTTLFYLCRFGQETTALRFATAAAWRNERTVSLLAYHLCWLIAFALRTWLASALGLASLQTRTPAGELIHSASAVPNP